MTGCDRYDCAERDRELGELREQLADLEAIVAVSVHGSPEDADVARGWLEGYVGDGPLVPNDALARWYRLLADGLERVP